MFEVRMRSETISNIHGSFLLETCEVSSELLSASQSQCFSQKLAPDAFCSLASADTSHRVEENVLSFLNNQEYALTHSKLLRGVLGEYFLF